MKPIVMQLQIVAMVALLLLSAGCATRTTMYTPQSRKALVVDAGFRPIPANSARRQQILQMLPADTVTYVRRNGRDYYVYPDMANNQLFVGMKPQYQTYRQLAFQNRVAVENVEAAPWTAPADWGVWGPWGWGRTRLGFQSY